jgi:hypothetical protein
MNWFASWRSVLDRVALCRHLVWLLQQLARSAKVDRK